MEENHYYAFGLKIAAISSKKYSDSYDGEVKNNFGMQGAYAEMDDDIGWNDFALRNYDPQIGRWMQQDPYQQFASPYTGMGNDPTNNIDPSGGVSLPAGIGQAANFMSDGVMMAEVVVTATRVVTGGAKGISIGQVVLKISSIVSKTLQGLNILNKIVGTNQVGSPWQGGYNQATGKWENIIYEGKTYEVLSKTEIEVMFGQTGQQAELRYEGLALKAFGQRRNTSYVTKHRKKPDGISKTRLIDLFAKAKYEYDLDRDIYEIKLLGENRNLGADDQQKSFIEDVANSAAGRRNIGSVWYVTTGHNAIALDLRAGASSFGVNVFQSVAYRDPSNPNVIYFSQWVGVTGTPGAIKYNALYGRKSPLNTGPFAAAVSF